MTNSSWWSCCVGIITCLQVSSVTVNWTSVESTNDKHNLPAHCITSSLVYICTLRKQLVECCSSQLKAAIDLPFSDGVSISEFHSATASSLLVVMSRSHVLVVVDVTKHQVILLLLLLITSAFHVIKCPAYDLSLSSSGFNPSTTPGTRFWSASF